MRVIVLALVLSACAPEPPLVVQSSRRLSPNELERVQRDVKAALPPDCDVTAIAVQGTQAAFDYACGAR